MDLYRFGIRENMSKICYKKNQNSSGRVYVKTHLCAVSSSSSSAFNASINSSTVSITTTIAKSPPTSNHGNKEVSQEHTEVL